VDDELVRLDSGGSEPALVERRLRGEPDGGTPHAAVGEVQPGRRVVERSVDQLPHVRARLAELLERAERVAHEPGNVVRIEPTAPDHAHRQPDLPHTSLEHCHSLLLLPWGREPGVARQNAVRAGTRRRAAEPARGDPLNYRAAPAPAAKSTAVREPSA